MSQDAGASRPSAAPGRELLVIAGLVLALVVVSVAVVLLASPRQATYAPGTPERALQDYLAAYERHAYDDAYDAFSQAAQAQASRTEYRAMASGMGGPGVSRRVLIDGRRGSGDRIALLLTVEESSGGGFDAAYRSSREVAMVREGGAWRIDSLLLWLDPGPWGDGRPYI